MHSGNWTIGAPKPPRNPIRDESAIRFAEVMLKGDPDSYVSNPVLNKSRLDYIAEDAVYLADKIGTLLNGYPSNITPIQPTEA